MDALTGHRREQMERYAPIVHKIARWYARNTPSNVTLDDLTAAGMAGLWSAIVRHGQTHETFEAYVRIRVRGAIIDELRHESWLPRRVKPGTYSFEYLDGQDIPLLEILEERDSFDVLAKAVSQLAERERTIIEQHYQHGVRFDDLARRFSVSPPRISQLHARALKQLRELIDNGNESHTRPIRSRGRRAIEAGDAS